MTYPKAGPQAQAVRAVAVTVVLVAQMVAQAQQIVVAVAVLQIVVCLLGTLVVQVAQVL
jgi:hypothetical protein